MSNQQHLSTAIKRSCLIGSLLMATLISNSPAQGQSITEASDGTGTTVNQNGSQFDIQGGTSSGSNLFHSFDQFNLGSGETANFQATSSIENILGRIVGGDASIINGRIQVSGSNANLFLLNPAGIVFGADATLNVMGDFTASTANGIGFGSGNWFYAIGNNDYTALTGTPSEFVFGSENGAIINYANLALEAGSNLTLLGSTVLSTGDLAAPGGRITVAAVPGSSVARIGQPGHLLHLDIDTANLPSIPASNLPAFQPLDLPGLLTGASSVGNATQVTVNSNNNVVLTGSGLSVLDGDVVVNNVDSSSTTESGGDIAISTDKALIAEGDIDSSSSSGTGGEIALEAKTNIIPGNIDTTDNNITLSGPVVLESDIAFATGSGSGDITFSSTVDGNSELSLDAGTGNVEFKDSLGYSAALTLLDIDAGDVSATSTINLGGELKINASGAVNLSSIVTTNGNPANIEARDKITTNSILTTGGDIRLISNEGAIDTSAGLVDSSSTTGTGGKIAIEGKEDVNVSYVHSFGNFGGEDISIVSHDGAIDSFSIVSVPTISEDSGHVTLEAEKDITVGLGIVTNFYHLGDAGNVSVTSDRGDINIGTIDSRYHGGSGGNVDLTAKNGEVNLYQANSGGELGINANGAVNLSSTVTTDGSAIDIEATDKITTNRVLTDGGDIRLVSNEGAIDTSANLVDSSSTTGTGGKITIEGKEDVNVSYVHSFGNFGGEDISIVSHDGAIDAFSLVSVPTGSEDNGHITLEAENDITLGLGIVTNFYHLGDAGNVSATSHNGDISVAHPINTETNYAAGGQAGDVTLQAPNGAISIRSIDTDSRKAGNKGGDISIQAGGDITSSETIHTDGTDNADAGNVEITSTEGDLKIHGIQARIFGESSVADGGSIALEAQGDITTGALWTDAYDGDAGSINVRAGGRVLAPVPEGSTYISARSRREGDGGEVDIQAGGDIVTAGSISTNSNKNDGGSVSVTSDNGSVTIGSTFTHSSGSGDSGPINISALGDLEVGELFSISFAGDGGDISLTTGGKITMKSGHLYEHFAGNCGVFNAVNVQCNPDESLEITSNGTSPYPTLTWFFDNYTLKITAPSPSTSQSPGNPNDNSNETGDSDRPTQTGDSDRQTETEDNDNSDRSNPSIEGIEVEPEDNGDTGSITVTLELKEKDTSETTQTNTVTVSTENNEDGTTTFSVKDSNGSGTQSNSTTAPTEDEDSATPASEESGNTALERIENPSIIASPAFGQGGEVTLEAGNDIEGGSVLTRPLEIGSGGNISAASSQGGIDFDGELNSSGRNDSGGNVTLAAQQDINVSGDIDTSSQTRNGPPPDLSSIGLALPAETERILTEPNPNATGGNVSIESTAGSVNVANINSSSDTGNGGNIEIAAQNDITTADINTSSPNIAGSVSLASQSGDVNTGNINALGGVQDGAVTISAPGEINTGVIQSDNISINPPPPPSAPSPSSSPIGGSFLPAPNIPVAPTPATVPAASPATQNLAAAPVQAIPETPAISNLPVAEAIAPPPPEILCSQSSCATGIQAQQQLAPAIAYSSNITPSNVIANPILTIIDPIAALDQGNIEKAVLDIEESFTRDYANYAGQDYPGVTMNLASIRDTLKDISQENENIKPAVIYAIANPEQVGLVMITAEDKLVNLSKAEIGLREDLIDEVQSLYGYVQDKDSNRDAYLEKASKLYDELIKPLEAQLEKQGINTLIFSMDRGLRLLPLAALHDGDRFLVEKYNIALIPSVSLMDTSYVGLKNSPVLAMGADNFPNSGQDPLPKVPIELETITDLWSGETLFNEAFTLDGLKAARHQRGFAIVHLATHAAFVPQSPDEEKKNYIQFWDGKVGLDQLREVEWYNQSMVELLVLSACQTAVGDAKAEMGFAGLAVQAGVKSAVASLWKVSDTGTLGLMAQFYQNLKTAPSKAEALRQAQLAMLRREVRIEGNILVATGDVSIPLEGTKNSKANNTDLTHPYYWAAFTTIGSPW